MPVTGIHHVNIETHDLDASIRFWTELGFTQDEHMPTILRAADGGPYLILDEVPDTQPPRTLLYFDVADPTGFAPAVEIAKRFEPTHWGTSVMLARDPDGVVRHLQDGTGTARS